MNATTAPYVMPVNPVAGNTSMLLDTLFFISLVAKAMTAALAAGRRSMDWVGVCLLSCVTALGGGSARDILLDHYPLAWIKHPDYLALTIGSALLTIAVARAVHNLRQLFLILDAVGLVVSTVIGCDVALQLGEPLLIVIISGLVSGCVGGVLRDILCNEIPLLFRSELYASISVFTGGLYIGGRALGLSHGLVTAVSIGAGMALRLLALRYRWNMPKFVYARDPD